MSTLLESSREPLSIADVAAISRPLAEDISRLVLRTEGFSVEDYLSLNGRYFVEYLNGCLQVLPMPTALHQAIAFVLATLLTEWSKSDQMARTKLGPFRVRVNERAYREPDVCFMLGENAGRRNNLFWEGADLVIEVLSESNRDHDVHTKYAGAGIPEYWIIDSSERVIRVFILRDNQYVPHGEFGPGQTATSVLLKGFAVQVARLFEMAEAQA